MDVGKFDPGLRTAARMAGLLTASTSRGFLRTARVAGLANRWNPRRRESRTPRVRVRGDIEVSGRWTPRRDGGRLRLVVVRPVVPRSGATGVLWIHGGGYALGSPEMSIRTARRLVTATDCVVVLPDYRLSSEQPYPAALDDCYDALLWLREHAAELQVATDPGGGGRGKRRWRSDSRGDARGPGPR